MKALPVLLVLLTLCSWDNCGGLDDGQYRVVYNLTTEGAYNLKIKRGKYVQYIVSGDSIQGTIKRISPCLIVLEPLISDTKILRPDSLTDIGKKMRSFGDPCMELIRKNADTIYFRMTYSGNLHLTCNEGKLIRLKN